MNSRCHFTSRIIFAVLLVVFPNAGRAQYPNQNFVEGGVYALDVPADARGSAMGESFVALQANPTAMMYNPAGLVGLDGMHLLYAQRGLLDLHYRTLASSFHTSLIDIGVMYGRFDMGGYEYVFSDGMSDKTTHIDTYNHILAISAARAVSDQLAVGLTIKTFDVSRKATASWYSLETTRPVLFDIGLLFSHPGFLGDGQLEDRFTAGTALQNFGTDFRGTERIADVTTEGPLRLPRYIRVGFSYTVTMKSTDESTHLFSMLVTAEYRGLLNVRSEFGDNRDFWGFGVETTLLDLFSARLGGYVQPFKSVNGSRGIPSLRYGAGINIPFSRLGITIPLELKVEYAGMPIQNYSESISQTYNAWDVELVCPISL